VERNGREREREREVETGERADGGNGSIKPGEEMCQGLWSRAWLHIQVDNKKDQNKVLGTKKSIS
jgi:hypothetical protein